MPRTKFRGERLQTLSEWVETKTGRSRLEVQRVELRKLIRIAEAGAAVAEYDQTYEGHEDDSSDEGPAFCTICSEKGDRMYALEDALAALEESR